MSKKDEITTFEKLERLNAQIDVWIDEENFEAICEHLGQNFSDDFYKDAFESFHNPKKTCSNSDDVIWESFLTESHGSRKLSPPIAEVKLPDGKIEQLNVEDGNSFDAQWSRLFWAKLVRAMIMQKGTDCFLHRLDTFMIYLERNIPIPSTEEALRFHIIYLLELATYGIGADWKSFAERARRILIEPSTKRKLGENFTQFYDLLSRYSIGIYCFHEGKDGYEKALEEFDYIIKKINCKKNNRDWADYFNYRMGVNLLYLPAVIYTSEVFLKLQLAFHALKILEKYLRDPSKYKQVKANCLRAESYIYLGEYNEARCCLNNIIQEFLSDRKWAEGKSEVDWQRIFHDLGGNIVKWPALKGRLLGQMFAQITNRMKSDWQKKSASNDPEDLLNTLDHLCELYWTFSEKTASERNGFLEQLAESFTRIKESADYFKSVDKHHWSTMCENFANRIYKKYSAMLIPVKPTDIEQGCRYCGGNKNINLKRLKQEHVEEYKKNIFKFHEWIPSYKEDKKNFEEVVSDHESGYNPLQWQIYKRRNSQYERQFGCQKCFLTDNKSFHGLLICRKKSPPEPNADVLLSDVDYEKIMEDWEDHFQDHLVGNTLHLPAKQHLHFLGLQRWNSSSPAMGKSIGGGYLLYHTNNSGTVDLGVAIDPGFDFVRNLFRAGFSLADIDIVLMSHAHVDHVRDFESMLTLLLELKKNNGASRKLHALMTSGVYARLKYLIESPGLREFVEPYIIDIYKDLQEDYINELPEFSFSLNKNGKIERNARWRPQVSRSIISDQGLALVIKPQKSYHNDHSDLSDSFGFIIELKEEDGKNFSFGYTGDTKWHPEVIPQYKSCNALLVHLGSLINRNNSDENERFFKHYNGKKECFSLITKKNHPYLPGLLHFLAQFVKMDNTKGKDTDGKRKKRLVLVSEFGEELRGGIRKDLIKRLSQAYSEKLDVLPVDVGLDVLLKSITTNENSNNLVMCVQCEKHVEIDRARFMTYGHDEAIFCICVTCRKSAPLNVLQDKLKSLYEAGNILRKGLSSDG